VHRGYALRDGVYVDALAMARLHPNPPQVQRQGDVSGQAATPSRAEAAWPHGGTA